MSCSWSLAVWSTEVNAAHRMAEDLAATLAELDALPIASGSAKLFPKANPSGVMLPIKCPPSCEHPRQNEQRACSAKNTTFSECAVSLLAYVKERHARCITELEAAAAEKRAALEREKSLGGLVVGWPP